MYCMVIVVNNIAFWGLGGIVSWMSNSWFWSGPDLWVVWLSPALGSALNVESPWDFLSPSLYPSPLLSLSLFLILSNK